MKAVKLNFPLSAIAVSAALVACGGGGGGSAQGESTTLTGTVASGRAFPAGTTISVTDATGAEVSTTKIKSTDGTYSITIPGSAIGPLIITATADEEETLISVKADTKNGNVNVTPQSHLIAASLSPSGDPTKLASEIKAGSATVTQTSLDSKVAEVQSLMSSVTTALNVNSNPLTGDFKADGTDLDRVLDSVKISVLPQGDGSSEVQVAIKADDSTIAAPVTFKAGAGSATRLNTTALPAVTSAALPPANLISNVNGLLKRIETCFNLPKNSRVDNQGLGPSNIIANECKGIYWNSDPSTYKNNSYTVGASAVANATSVAWSTIFTNPDTTKLAWDQGTFQFVIKNPAAGQQVGDVVFTSRWTATFPCSYDTSQTCSNTAVDTYVVRADSTGKLYLVGNQSNYDIGVDARAEFRDFPHFKDTSSNSYSYLNVGYNLYVKDTGTIGKTVVTTPSGNKVLLKPIPGGGYSYLGLTKGNGTITSTSVLRLSGAYLNPNTASSSGVGTIYESANHPRDIDGSLFWSAVLDQNHNFVSWKNWTDAELAAIPDQGVWTFQIYDTNNTLVATEKRRTINRSPTLAEAKQIIWPSLSAELRDALITRTTTTGGFALSSAGPIYVTSDMTSSGNAGWVVPPGAWAPLGVKVYGSYVEANRTVVNGFDDNADVRSSWRKATIYCSGSDGHCANNGAFKPYSSSVRYSAFFQLQLNGRDARRVQNTVSVNFRKN